MARAARKENEAVYKITKRVNPELQAGEKYTAALNALMKMLELEADLNIFCAHEAGHATYFLKMGVKESDLVYAGPTILPDPIHALREYFPFDFYPCAVGPSKEIMPQSNTELEALAKAAVAGGVFEKELEESPKLGDKDDRCRFRRAYKDASDRGVRIKLGEQELWDWAQEQVRQDLADPLQKAEARERAKIVKSRCFESS